MGSVHIACTKHDGDLCAFLCFSAWAKVDLNMHEGVEVYLGDSAQIPCRYNFTDADNKPSFFMIQWFVRAFRQPASPRTRIFYGDDKQQMVDNNTDYSGRIQVTSDQQGTQLTIQDVQLSDEREFFCQVNGLVAGSAEGKTHLRVFVIEGVTTGISVTNKVPSKVASCEARNGYPKPNITWYRNSMPLMNTPGYVNVLILVTRKSNVSGVSVQSTLNYKVVKEDKDAHFSCEVSFFVPGAIRTVESNSINITVHYPTTMVELWKESPQGLVKEGDTVELRCQGDGNPPPVFIFNREQELDVDLESNHGNVLMLSPVTRKDSGIYQCRGPQLVGVEQEVQLEEATGRMVNLSCEVQGHPLPSLSWTIIGSQNWHEVVNKANEHIIHSVVSVKVTSDTSALCNASNDLGTEVKAFSIRATEGSGVIIVVIILCLLLLAVLGSVLYFLHKKGKIPCGRSGKQEISTFLPVSSTKEKTTKDDIVVEMKTNTKNEEAVLLKAVNGDKKGPSDQNSSGVSAAQSLREETGSSAASKPLSARAGNDSNSSSDFQLESDGRKDRKQLTSATNSDTPRASHCNTNQL
ncbi:hypothetical protein FQN60_000385, partial [Etheostoma spectabile]